MAFDMIREQIRGKLVVSCQASPGDPLENTDAIRRIAQAAIRAGARALRINSAEHIAAIRQDTDVPIIAIQKRYRNGALLITPDFAAASELASAGASIIALDCTNRSRPDAEPWQQLIARINTELNLPTMADIATLQEAQEAARAGADFVGTTLHGYTEQTQGSYSFNWQLLAQIVKQVAAPVIAEGHISTPEDAARAIRSGAWCVVVGSAITRPGVITTGYLNAVNRAASQNPVIGVDIGGTSIKAGLVSRTGEISSLSRVLTNASKGRDAIADALVRAVTPVLYAAQEQGKYVRGIGIASAGAIETSTGSVFAATENLPGWIGFPLRAFAEERFQLPARTLNDAQAAALAELHFGFGRGLTDFAAITIGTGIGSGVVANGKLLRGNHGFAGTIGHHVIRIDGQQCNCGRKGCLEAYVSTQSLLREFSAQGGVTDATADAAQEAARISKLAQQGAPEARQAYMAIARYLAEGLANLFNLLDPQMVILSGGIIDGQTEFIAEVQKQVTQILHFGDLRRPQIVMSSAGPYAGMQGAGALGLEEL